jgi:hypothetical protein
MGTMSRTARVSLLCAAAFASTALAVAAPAVSTAATTLTIATSDSTVRFSNPIQLTGRLTKTTPLPAVITLQQDTYPFDNVFQAVAQTSTNASGNYAFPGVRPGGYTKYRVQSVTVPRRTSRVLSVKVSVSVRLKLGDYHPRAGRLVTFFGTAKPALDGNLVRVQRFVGGGAWKTIKQTTLSTDVGGSKYATHVRLWRTGSYRVVVSGNKSLLSGTRTRTIVVRRHS